MLSTRSACGTPTDNLDTLSSFTMLSSWAVFAHFSCLSNDSTFYAPWISRHVVVDIFKFVKLFKSSLFCKTSILLHFYFFNAYPNIWVTFFVWCRDQQKIGIISRIPLKYPPTLYFDIRPTGSAVLQKGVTRRRPFCCPTPAPAMVHWSS